MILEKSRFQVINLVTNPHRGSHFQFFVGDAVTTPVLPACRLPYSVLSARWTADLALAGGSTMVAGISRAGRVSFDALYGPHAEDRWRVQHTAAARRENRHSPARTGPSRF